MGGKLGHLQGRRKRGFTMFDNRVLRKILGPKTDEVTGEWR
jgi:hypothetical protein